MNKIITENELHVAKSKGMVLVGGCFDIIHPAHIKFLKLSKKQGKLLVVLLESDERIKQMKGEDRPLNNQSIRAQNLAKLPFVDYVVLLSMPSSPKYYYNLVKLLEPDIIAVTSGDPLLADKEKQAKMVSAKVVEVMERDNHYSTTNLIKKKTNRKT